VIIIFEKTSKDLQRAKYKREIMTQENAIKYLKLLHKLEKKYSNDIFTIELKEIIEKLRFEFIAIYNGRD
jgi:hypothetical protein